MSYQTFKNILTFLFIVVLANSLNVSYARSSLDCNALSSALSSGEAPYLVDIVCPLSRVVVALMVFAGAAFIVAIVYAAVKASMALGDPKGLQGAKLTWTYAGVGFAVIIGAIAGIVIMANTFDISINPADFPNQVANFIYNFMLASGLGIGS